MVTEDAIEADDCKRLWAAVMVENLKCAYGTVGHRITQMDKIEAVRWIKSRDFVDICDLLSLDPVLVRRRLDSVGPEFDWSGLDVQAITGKGSSRYRLVS